MTPHAPKTAALEALAADLLSDEGTRRIRAHLRTCEVCREHFATIHVYRESQDFIAKDSPRVDWSKMEDALASEARAQAAEHRRAPAANEAPSGAWRVATLGGAVALAAAALVGMALLRGGSGPAPSSSAELRGPAPVREPTIATPEIAPSSQHATAVLSMVAGDASFASALVESDTRALAVGQRVSRGMVMTGALGQAAFVLERPSPGSSTDASGVVLANVTIGALAQLEVGEVVAADGPDGVSATHTSRLSRGRATVDAFARSSRVVVLAGSYRVEIRAARCTIDLDEASVARVAVSMAYGEEAEVTVIDGEGQRIALDLDGLDLDAVGRDGVERDRVEGRSVSWSSAGPETTTADAALAPLPLALAEGPLVSLSFPEAVRFEVGETSYEGGPTLALRVPVGAITVRAFDAAGRSYRAEIDVGPEGLALTPDRLEPVRPRIVGFLPPEDITPVVQRSQRALQRCYELAMRLHPEISSSAMRARVTLDSRGAVRVVRIEGESVPPSLEQCVRQEAAQWHFPSPGGPLSFELPLRFHARQ